MKRRPLFALLLLAACAHGAGRLGGDSPDTAPAVGPGPVAPEDAHDPGGAPVEARPLASPEADSSSQPQAQPNLPEEPREKPEPSTAPTANPSAELEARQRLVRAARGHLGRRFAGDCSAFVRRIYAEAGVALPVPRVARGMSESLYRSMPRVSKPQAGDLAYFRGTRRRARGDRDRITHVAVVEAVDGARVRMIHRGSRGVRRLAMNLERPHDPSENGIVRRGRSRDGRRVGSLAGELFAGFATALDGDGQGAASTP